jgi:SAM-dependent methyltransferase
MGLSVMHLLSYINNLFPKSIIKKARYFGISNYCPICCSYLKRFYPFGDPPRENAQCPVCKSLERHRLIWMFFRVKKNYLINKFNITLLHFAPEHALRNKFLKMKNINYINGDLYRSEVIVKFDIRILPFLTESIDLIYCCHVLEHIDEDLKAMKEMHRILKHRGAAIIQVPITAKQTLEDLSVTDPTERKRIYGQSDHVRRYGPDIKGRLISAGFSITILSAVDLLGLKSINRLGINKSHQIFICNKHDNA